MDSVHSAFCLDDTHAIHGQYLVSKLRFSGMLGCVGRVVPDVSVDFTALISKIMQSKKSECPQYGPSKRRRA
jgi:hypothetical protein